MPTENQTVQFHFQHLINKMLKTLAWARVFYVAATLINFGLAECRSGIEI